MATKRKRKGKRGSGLGEMFAKMDAVYAGALEVIKRSGVVATPEESDIKVTRVRGASKARIAPPVPEIVAFAKEQAKGGKVSCALIRIIANHFKQASVAEIRASLPDTNPSTVGIQVGKARRSG